MAHDVTGIRFGKLVAISKEPSKVAASGHTSARWLFNCDCGKFKVITLNDVKNGKISSCGCYRQELRRSKAPRETQGWVRHYQAAKHGAKKRNLEWKLTTDQYIEICKQNCTYCGIEPQKNETSYNQYISTCIKQNVTNSEEFAKIKIVFKNGVDRIDSDLGYIINNVVPSCRTCNIAKLDRTVEEWNNWIERIIEHRRING